MAGRPRPMFWTRFFRAVARPFIHLRYRVSIDGLEAARQLRGPVLVLPNHPAYADPPINLSHLGHRNRAGRRR